MKTAVCTISTKSHLFKSKAVLASVAAFVDVDLFCLVVDELHVAEIQSQVEERYEGLAVLDSPLAHNIKAKYRQKMDKLRWACKPLYINELIRRGYEKVIYVDNDIFFYSSPQQIIDSLSENNILLTPHFYSASPIHDQNWLEANYRVGLYNAGFIGVNKNAVDAMEWWASCCLYNVKKSAWRGLFDDQKYLDLIPIIYPKVSIAKHPGYNLAGWNMHRYEYSLQEDNQVIINREQPVVFVHFAKMTFQYCMASKNSALHHMLKVYINTLKKFNPAYQAAQEQRRRFADYLLYFRHIMWLINRKFE